MTNLTRQVRDPENRRRVNAGLLFFCAVMLILATVAGWIAYDAQRRQAESGTDLASDVARACATNPVPADLTGLCQQANRVIREEPLPEAQQAPEIQEREIQNPEHQDPERQNPEHQNPEHQRREHQQPENQQSEVQNPELQQDEVQDGDPNNPDPVDDPDPNDPDPVDDPDPNDPDPDDPDPNSALDFQVRDECNPPAGEVVTDVGASWERSPGTITLVLSCSSVAPPPQG